MAEGAGRNTKRTSETEERIFSLLKAGNTRRTAALVAGITEQTFCNWMNSVPEFSTQVQLCEEEAVATAVAMVKQAGVRGTKKTKVVSKKVEIAPGIFGTETVTTEEFEQDWKAAAWYLERKRPEDWREKVTVENVDDLDGLTDEELEALEKIQLALARTRDDKGAES